MTAVPLPHPPAIIRRHVSIGTKIARTALSLVGSRNRRFYPNSRTACAAFTSAVLVKAGALPRSMAAASAVTLFRNLILQRWQKVGPMTVAQAARRAKPGDVLFFSRCGRCHLVHVGLVTGLGRFVGTSSSRGRVLPWVTARWPSQHVVRMYRHR
jgi:cell wall-associated NlpC family hydrolase